ncbi:MAG: hypothetical protein ACRC41_05260 [Sarcina sp.]
MKNKFDFTTIILAIVLIILAILAIMSFVGGTGSGNSLSNNNNNNNNSIQFINSGFNPNTVNYNPQSPSVIQMQNNNASII